MPNSIVTMDNCAIHHIEEVIGAIIHFLPPYSPDYNPIKCKVNTSMEVEMKVTEYVELIVRSAFAAVTDSDCLSWIRECGIYNMNY